MNLQSKKEIEVLEFLVDRVKKIEGDIIEVGVYNGYSAKTIVKYKGEKKLWLFDTFDGFPDATEYEKTKLSCFNFNGRFEEVKSFNFPNTEIVRGYFPINSPFIDEKFSFVHIDVDTYKSTLECLKYLFPKMNKGGIIVIHDYEHSSLNVKSAVNDFDINTIVFNPGTSQGIIWI